MAGRSRKRGSLEGTRACVFDETQLLAWHTRALQISRPKTSLPPKWDHCHLPEYAGEVLVVCPQAHIAGRELERCPHFCLL